ncbi:MAG: hypothetical protein ACRDQZ_09965, partial [Mycobacteriales bacterium]
ELDLAVLWDDSAARLKGCGLEPTIPLGWLCFAALKTQQGERGSPDKHRVTMAQAIMEILACVMSAGQMFHIDVLPYVWSSWVGDRREQTWRCQNPRCWRPLPRHDMGDHCSPECTAAAVNGLF